jgi:hypothetical protein
MSALSPFSPANFGHWLARRHGRKVPTAEVPVQRQTNDRSPLGSKTGCGLWAMRKPRLARVKPVLISRDHSAASHSLVERLHSPCIVHGMVPQSVEYDENARACEERARKATESSLKEMWLRIAQQWRQMADRIREHGM